MPRFMRRFLTNRLLPEDLAIATADSEHHELLGMGQGPVVVGTRTIGEARLDGLTVRDRCGQEEALPPDDRRGVPLARQGRLPADVLGFAPFEGRAGVRRHAGAQRSPPLRPMVLALLPSATGIRRQEQARERELADDPLHTEFLSAWATAGLGYPGEILPADEQAVQPLSQMVQSVEAMGPALRIPSDREVPARMERSCATRHPRSARAHAVWTWIE